VTVKAIDTASGTVNNTVSVTSVSADPNTGNNNANETTTIIYNQTDLSITKRGPVEPVVIGSQFDYTITVNNAGPAVAKNVILRDMLPSDVSFVSASPTPNSGPYEIVWNLGDMQPGEKKNITVTVYVEPWARENFTNVAIVSTDTNETDTSNNEDSASTTVPPGTAVTITDFSLQVAQSDEITIQWVAVNEIDIYGYKVFRSNAGDFNSAEFIKFYDAAGDGTYTHADAPGSGDIWYYWLVVVSNSNNDSPPYGPLMTANPYSELFYLPNIYR
jgi:uncharacterized repeat protein (TIGR01451 family)